MKIKQYFCKWCTKEFIKYKSTDKCCSIKCIEKLNESKVKQKRAKIREKFGTTAKTSTLKKQADAVFSDWIRKRDHYTCVTCGFPGDKATIDNGHYIPRKLLVLRYDETNCHAQCKTCNGVHNLNIEPYREYMIDTYGEKYVKELAGMTKIMSKGSKQFFVDIINQYKITSE